MHCPHIDPILLPKAVTVCQSDVEVVLADAETLLQGRVQNVQVGQNPLLVLLVLFVPGCLAEIRFRWDNYAYLWFSEILKIVLI